MSEINYFTPETAGFRNRSPMLLVVGILFIIAGAISGCLGMFVPLALLVPRSASMPQQSIAHIISALALYAGLAAVGIVVGIGAVRKRRWAPPLILAVSCMGLVVGVFGVITWAFRAPRFIAGMKQTMTAGGAPAPPPGMINFIIGVMAIFMLMLYLVVPGVLIWLFKDDNVRQTVAFYDPKPRWTDRLPLAALILFLASILAAIFSLVAITQGWWPMFGAVLYGTAARVAAIVLAIGFSVAAWEILKLRMTGWWLAVVLWTLYVVSWIVTISSVDMRDVYQRAGIDTRQLQIMIDTHTLPDRWMALGSGVFLVGLNAFAVYARRQFGTSGAGAVPPPKPQSPST
jgi:hypothetical protein